MDDIFLKTVGQRIFDIRKSKKLTQKEFGELLGDIDRSLISKWEQGKNLPNRERLEIIASIGNMNVDELLNGDSSNDDYFFEIPNLPITEAESDVLDMMRDREQYDREQADKQALLDAIQYLSKANHLINGLYNDFDDDNMMLFTYMYTYTSNMLGQIKETLKSSKHTNKEVSRIIENNELNSESAERVMKQIEEWQSVDVAKNIIKGKLTKLNEDNKLTEELESLNVNDATNINELIRLLNGLNIANNGLIDTIEGNIDY